MSYKDEVNEISLEMVKLTEKLETDKIPYRLELVLMKDGEDPVTLMTGNPPIQRTRTIHIDDCEDGNTRVTTTEMNTLGGGDVDNARIQLRNTRVESINTKEYANLCVDITDTLTTIGNGIMKNVTAGSTE